MSEPLLTPIPLPSGHDFQQWAFAINQFSQLLSQRLAASRERAGRMARSDAEQSDLEHLARQVPPLRLMRDDEQEAWTRRVPADLATQFEGEPSAVWWAKMDDEGTGWGVEAHTYTNSGAPSASLFVVCRDAEDAADLAKWLRDHPTPADLTRIHELAGHRPGEFSDEYEWSEPNANAGPRMGGRARPLALGEDAWAEALHRNVPGTLATRLTDERDPMHPDFAAWQELHALANEEVSRVGADPDRLAMIIGRALSSWREVKWPSRAAYSVLNQARELPRYEDTVRAPGTDREPGRGAPPPGGGMVVDGEVVATSPPRPGPGSSPADALRWARGLDPDNTEHRFMAKAEYTRWGQTVDRELERKFPSVVPRSKAAARAEARRRGESPVAAAVTGETAAEVMAARELDADTTAELAETVRKWDPDKAIDRRSALTMFGHSYPEVDAMIVEKFPDDERIQQRAAELYPDGIPEAAAWHGRADKDEGRAAADRATPDDPDTPTIDERADGQANAANEQNAANAENAAGKAAAARPATVHRTATTTPARPRTR
ncbi:hypothetical protein CU254_41780 (plasmid) [Amycolatopsis sp. AA4]|uniref:hypothetical protein n=1 Tax=Actinomycetes TaxID=1760 RepID=UPI0001B5714D|nr:MULTISPECIES: hypothetical protein [Actinomycetes]ATY17110.1 hypothetical protein CU254_41780 [Amycolatopsis sp. AA4]